MFALIWWDEALDQLADIYVSANPDERNRIAAAVDALNSRLRTDPFAEGEGRAGNNRVAFVSLLSVGFNVSKADRIVRVTRVTRYGR